MRKAGLNDHGAGCGLYPSIIKDPRHAHANAHARIVFVAICGLQR